MWKVSNEVVSFNECDIAELSTISEFNNKDWHSKTRGNRKNYDVTTISLIDLLEKYNAPKQIDYLSIDTEGSELEILKSFDFNQYDISIITCEHNYTEDRHKIFELLTNNGYVRVFTKLSECDD